MAKALPLKNSSGEHGGWLVECPACGYGHLFDSRWSFNGDVEKPTFSPSMLVNAGIDTTIHTNSPRCHSFVENGKIRFLSDCSHSMAGQTVDLPDIGSGGDS